MHTHGSDYLAVIPIVGGGCTWGRAADKDEAVSRAVRALRDWEHLFQVSGIEVTVNVTEVTGYGDCSWDYAGRVRGKNEATGKDERLERPVEQIKRVTPKWRRRK